MYRDPLQGPEIDTVELINAVEEAAQFLPSIPPSTIDSIAAEHKDIQGNADVHGSEHPVTLDKLLHLTESYISIRMYECPIRIFDRIVLGLKRCYGKDHVLVPTALSRKAYCFKEQRLYDKAIEYYLQALSGFELLHGEEHEILLPVLDGLGFCFLELQQPSVSEVYYTRLLRFHQKRDGADHPETLAAVTKLAAAYQGQDKHGQAEYICDDALESCINMLGKNHPITQRAVMTLAHVKHAQGRTRQAEQMYRKALSCNEQELGMKHVDTLRVVELIAALLTEQKSYQAAEVMYRRALRGYEEELGPDHMQTVAAAQCVGQMLVHLRRPEEALQFFHRVHDAYESYHGERHPLTIEAKFLMGQAYHVQSLWRHRPEAADHQQAAIRTFEQALKGLDDVLGADHSRTIEVVDTLANVLLQANNFQQALPYWRRLYEARALNADVSDDNATAIAYQLASVYERLSNYKAAAPLFNRAYEGYSWQLREIIMRIEQQDSKTLTTFNDGLGEKLPFETKETCSKDYDDIEVKLAVGEGALEMDADSKDFTKQGFGESVLDVSFLTENGMDLQESTVELVDNSIFSADVAAKSTAPAAAASEAEQLENRVVGAGRRALLSRSSTANTATWELEMKRDELQHKVDDARDQFEHAQRRSGF